MIPFRKFCLPLSGFALAGLGAGLLLGMPAVWAPCAVVAALALALGLGAVPALKSYQYTAWIIVAVVAAMIYPTAFLKWGDFDLRHKWVVLVVVQTVMFGMGTQMSLKDFVGVMKMPWGVVVAATVALYVLGFARAREAPEPR